MRREQMLKRALIFSLIGLFGLSLLAYISELPTLDISRASESIGQTVVAEGKIASVSYHPDVTFLEICASTCIKVVFFDLPSYKLEAGDLIEVEGKIKLYEGELEIIAEEISCIKC